MNIVRKFETCYFKMNPSCVSWVEVQLRKKLIRPPIAYRGWSLIIIGTLEHCYKSKSPLQLQNIFTTGDSRQTHTPLVVSRCSTCNWGPSTNTHTSVVSSRWLTINWGPSTNTPSCESMVGMQLVAPTNTHTP